MTRQRQPRVEDPKFLAYLRQQRCCACGAPPPSQAAHVRMSSAAHGAINPGVGAKPDDARAVSLCQDCHLDGPQAQHRVGERAFWARIGLNPFELALGQRRAFLALSPEPTPQTGPQKVTRPRKRNKNKGTSISGNKKQNKSRTIWPSRPIQSRGFR